jgi:hypothetical protein
MSMCGALNEQALSKRRTLYAGVGRAFEAHGSRLTRDVDAVTNAIQIRTLIYYRVVWNNVISINCYTVCRSHIRRELAPVVHRQTPSICTNARQYD